MTSLVGIPLRMPASSLGKKRLVGLAILVIILSVFFSLNRFPKLDTVREDLEAVTGPKINVFKDSVLKGRTTLPFSNVGGNFL